MILVQKGIIKTDKKKIVLDGALPTTSTIAAAIFENHVLERCEQMFDRAGFLFEAQVRAMAKSLPNILYCLLPRYRYSPSCKTGPLRQVFPQINNYAIRFSGKILQVVYVVLRSVVGCLS